MALADDLPAQAAEAEAEVHGRVQEFGSGLPVRGTVSAGDRSAELDETGRFVLVVPAGDVSLHFEGPEHQPLDVTETIAAGQVLTVKYRMERFSWDDEIIVYGEEVREEVSRTVLSAEELSLVPGSFGDPIRAIQSLPGVARPNIIEGDIVVRGAEGVNTGFYIDEIPVPYLFHMFVGRSVVNPALLQEVEFYPGGMPSRFGDATQAILNAKTKMEPPEHGIHGMVSVDVMDAALASHGSFRDGEISWYAGGRLSWIGALIGVGANIITGATKDPYWRAGYPAPRYWDYNVRVAWERGDNRVAVTSVGSRDALIFVPEKYDHDQDGRWDPPDPVEVPYDPTRLLDSYFHRVQLRWDRDTPAWKQTTWAMAGTDYQSSLIEGIGLISDAPELGSVQHWTAMVKHEDRIRAGKVGTVLTGLTGTVQPLRVEHWRDARSPKDFVVDNDLQLSGAAWGELQVRYKGLFVAPGVRLAGHSFNDQVHFSPEPRLTLRYQLDPTWTATAFVGRFGQIPPAQRYSEGLGNPELGLMKAWQGSLGVEGRWSMGLSVDVTVYATQMRDLVVTDERVEVTKPPTDWDGWNSEVAWTTVVPEFRKVDGRAYGIEAMVRLQPGVTGLSGWLAVTLSRSLRYDEDGVFPGDYDQPFALTAVAVYRFPKAWRVSAKWQMTSGHPFTPLHGVYDAGSDYWQGLQGERNSERFPMFRQLDLRVDKTWTAKRARWTAYVDVRNAMNTKNYFVATYNPNFTKLYPQVWIPIIPSLGLEVRY